jgi:ketosteroid isomerase-like protein
MTRGKEQAVAHPNEELARKATDAISKGDMETFLSLHTDDTVIHFPGQGPLAGDYKGKDGVAQLFQKQMQMLDAPPEILNHDILANDEHVVVLNNTRAARKGRTLEQQQVVVIHPRDGKIAEVWLQFEKQQEMDQLASS